MCGYLVEPRVFFFCFLEAVCDIPHGRWKRQCNGEVKSEREAEERENRRGGEPGELSVNFLKVLHLMSHYFH